MPRLSRQRSRVRVSSSPPKFPNKSMTQRPHWGVVFSRAEVSVFVLVFFGTKNLAAKLNLGGSLFEVGLVSDIVATPGANRSMP